MPSSTLRQRLVGECVGSGVLAAIVVGSGIAAQQLSPTDRGLELLENAVVTGAGLFVLIAVFSSISGAHFNPVVSLVAAAMKTLPWRDALGYVVVQFIGCVAGAILANLMFARAVVSFSTQARASAPHLLAEVVASAGLVTVIFSLLRRERDDVVPAAVGAYIAAAYFFTSSTSFANPAIAVGRMFSNTFAGIAPRSVPGFVLAEVIGAVLAWSLVTYLFSTPGDS